MIIRSLFLWLMAMATMLSLHAEGLRLRVVAANLSSDRDQAYSPDNGNHSNPAGAGARILKSLAPDVVLIQEFNTTVPVRQWVNGVFGEGFGFAREEGAQIPNGVISRYPIVASGTWADDIVKNRGFFWAHLRLPGQRDLWVVSVHLHTRRDSTREAEAREIVRQVRKLVPRDGMLVVGGDFNTRDDDERCMRVLRRIVELPDGLPVDDLGNPATNAARKRHYDWVLVSEALQEHAVALEIAGRTFEHGLVFDTRVFQELEKIPPAQVTDSGVEYMQHMAVARDFLLPE